jgi:hypothetical protein
MDTTARKGMRKMAEKEIPPYRCTYCLHALEKDHTQDLFGSYGIKPRSDDVSNFISEVQTILRYTKAAADMLVKAEEESEETHYQLQLLVGELAEEALRRLSRAEDAAGIIWERYHDPETGELKITQTRKEGA